MLNFRASAGARKLRAHERTKQLTEIHSWKQTIKGKIESFINHVSTGSRPLCDPTPQFIPIGGGQYGSYQDNYAANNFPG